ncbi:Mrh transcription modulator under heat shock [Escherichia phage EcS1]|uniref:Uncharacterized protein n=1 Tax=Escherichia phage EcS1 TaxID=2083276 RepID=A0A2Z5ZBW4_9CAUD|nr:Mrh transcription modulator under heat shock [Escherichia phage EcS1]BBC78069.1 Hypothetical protein [Escherichia phage EcS1]
MESAKIYKIKLSRKRASGVIPFEGPVFTLAILKTTRNDYEQVLRKFENMKFPKDGLVEIMHTHDVESIPGSPFSIIQSFSRRGYIGPNGETGLFKYDSREMYEGGNKFAITHENDVDAIARKIWDFLGDIGLEYEWSEAVQKERKAIGTCFNEHEVNREMSLKWYM